MINNHLDLARVLKKTVEHEGDDDTNCNWSTWNGPQEHRKKKTQGIGNQG